MSRTQKATRFFAFLALVFILVGCSSPTTVVQPTQDVNPVRTEAAQTVVAKLTIEAALNPTATAAPTQAPAEPIVITATPEPQVAQTTATDSPTQAPTATLIPTAAPAGSGSGGTTSGSVVYPTRTPARPDNATLISQEPFDGTKKGPGQEFDGKWVLKNTGTTTWTTGYEYEAKAGADDPLALGTYYTLPKEVKPGETVTIYADMQTPPQAGRYVSNWQLFNENRELFFSFYMVIDVE